MKSLLQAAFSAFLLFAAGCYADRFTGVYDIASDFQGIDENSGVLEESGRTPEDEARIRDRLTAIAKEEMPVYYLDAGDKIEVRVYDHPDLGVTTRIGPDGTIGFAFMGHVKLAGLTIAEGAECIRKGLAPYVKNPIVSIVIMEINSETATIAGSCARPGVFGISNSTRLADLYAMAGSSASRLFNGVHIDVADLDHSIFVRDGELLPVDFHKAIDQGDTLHNIKMRRGDYIFIAQRMEASVIICGEVAHPHKRLFEPGMGLIECLTTAGWMLESHWKNVIIIRDGLSNPRLFKIDVDGILAGKRRNVLLKAGDIVYVPRDNMAEYNVFVKKLLPTAQLLGLIVSPFSTLNKME